VHAQLARNAGDAVPGGAPTTHLVPACASTRSLDGQVLLGLAGRWQGRRWSRAQLLGRFGDDHVFDVPSTSAQYIVQGCPSVRARVKPVCHLDRVGRPLPTTFGVRAGAIADE
jgi:hypothetical protein